MTAGKGPDELLAHGDGILESVAGVDVFKEIPRPRFLVDGGDAKCWFRWVDDGEEEFIGAWRLCECLEVLCE